MNYFGVQAQIKDNIIVIPHKEYKPTDIVIENDWSAASFWYEVAALSDEAEIIVKGLRMNSSQGDKIIMGIMEEFGVQTVVSGPDIILKKNAQSRILTSFEYDFSFYPDLVMPVAFTCAALNIPAVFTGVKNLEIKESNRLLALKDGLEKAGVTVELSEDSLFSKPGNGNISNSVFQSYNDHRLAMSIAPLALRGHIVIDNSLAVNKSYPEFWDQMTQAGFSCKTK
jgi:3-phosphoshikimate 1-carboxyvinyltransferase